MDKIWYRNPSKSEVIGRCAGMKKTNDHVEPTKVERLQKESTKNQQSNLNHYKQNHQNNRFIIFIA